MNKLKHWIIKLSHFLRPLSLVDWALTDFLKKTGGNTDPFRISPMQVNGALGFVPKKWESLVAKLGGKKDDRGNWTIETDNQEHIRKLKALWIRTPVDLINEEQPQRMTPWGAPMEDYIPVQDLGRGGEPTSIALLYACFPIFTCLWIILLHAVSHILPVGSPLATLIVAVPVLGIVGAFFAAEEMMGIQRAIITLIFGCIVPFLGITQSIPKGLFHNTFALVVIGIVALVVWTLFFQTQNHDNGKWNRGMGAIKELGLTVLALGALYYGIELLPKMFHTFLWLIPGCFLCVNHADMVWRTCAEQLVDQKEAGVIARCLRSMNPDEESQLSYRSQVVNAARDQSPLIDLGRSTGSKEFYDSPDLAPSGCPMRMSVNDLSTHAIVFGETGSGKTTSIARPVFKQWVEKDCGGALVLCGKGSLPEDLRPLIDIRVEAGKFRWALLQGIDGVQLGKVLRSFRPDGSAAKDSDNQKDPVWRQGAQKYIGETVYIHEALHKHELDLRRRWRRQIAKKRLREFGAIAVDDDKKLAEVRASRRDYENRLSQKRHYRWTYSNIWETVRECSKSRVSGEVGPHVKMLRTYLGFDGNGPKYYEVRKDHYTTLKAAFDGVYEFSNKAPQTKTSFWSNVEQMMAPLMMTATKFTDKQGHPWIEIEQGQDLSGALYGKTVGVFLSQERDGDQARICYQLARGFVYSGIRRRSGMDWKADGQKPCLFMYDECHLIIGEAETSIASVSRSLGGYFFFLTQSVKQFSGVAGFKEDEVKSLLNNFATKITFKADMSTYAWFEEECGAHWVKQGVGISYIGTGYLDVQNALTQMSNHALQDVSSPYRSWYQRIIRHGHGAMVLGSRYNAQVERAKNLKSEKGLTFEGDGHWHIRTGVAGGDVWDVERKPGMAVEGQEEPDFEAMLPIITVQRLSANIASKQSGRGFALLNRGGGRRYGFIKCDPVEAKDIKGAKS